MLPPAAEVGAPRLSVTGVLVLRKARKGLWGCWQGSLFRPCFWRQLLAKSFCFGGAVPDVGCRQLAARSWKQVSHWTSSLDKISRAVPPPPPIKYDSDNNIRNQL